MKVTFQPKAKTWTLDIPSFPAGHLVVLSVDEMRELLGLIAEIQDDDRSVHRPSEVYRPSSVYHPSDE